MAPLGVNMNSSLVRLITLVQQSKHEFLLGQVNHSSLATTKKILITLRPLHFENQVKGLLRTFPFFISLKYILTLFLRSQKDFLCLFFNKIIVNFTNIMSMKAIIILYIRCIQLICHSVWVPYNWDLQSIKRIIHSYDV